MTEIRFEDGAAYERYMGRWSQLAGGVFLDWLAPRAGLQWLDVGCGNGAFTELLVEQCAPRSITGVDPSEHQLKYARSRPALLGADFQLGDAMALPFPDNAFDAAVMPLVIFFVPDPSRGVAEMKRVVRAGGLVTAYAWDMPDGGFPYAALFEEMKQLGADVPQTPNPDVSAKDALRGLWGDAGLVGVATHTITVERTFDDFEDYWTTIQGGASVGPPLRKMPRAEFELLKVRMRARLPADAAGRITYKAWCNAVKGTI